MMLRNRKVVKGNKASMKTIEKRKKVSFRIEGRSKVNDKLSGLPFNCNTGLCKALMRCDCVSNIFQSSTSEDSTDSEKNYVPCQVEESRSTVPVSSSSNTCMLSDYGQTTNFVPLSSILEETVESGAKEDLSAIDAVPIEVIPIDVADSSDMETQTVQHDTFSNSGQTSDGNSSDTVILLDSPVSGSSGNMVNLSPVVIDSPVSENIQKSINYNTVFLDSPFTTSTDKRDIQSTGIIETQLSSSKQKSVDHSTSINVPELSSRNRKRKLSEDSEVEELPSRNRKRKLSEDSEVEELPSRNRKTKLSEDSGVEILYSVSGGKRQKLCRNPSDITVEKNMTLNVSKRQNFSISVTGKERMILPLSESEMSYDIIQIPNDKGSTIGDDVIFVGENDAEVSVIDTRKKQAVHRSMNINPVNNESSESNESMVDEVIILDSPSSKTPVQSFKEKSERMISVSTSVTGLIPHYTQHLLDFIPIGGKPTTETPKIPIRRRAKVGERRRRRWAEGNSNRSHNRGYKDQKREQSVHTHLTNTQNSTFVPAPNSYSASSSINGKQQTSAPEIPQSSTSIGANIYNPNASEKQKCGLRPVIIDGNNIAMGHGKGNFFSWRGLHICIKYFLKRGHKVTAFVPTFRKGVCPLDLRSEMEQYEKNGEVVFTPSRRVEGRLIVPYDDRFIVQCAAELGGVIVSTDNYRDLLNENSSWKETIERRLLMFTWVGDLLMFPNDPLGRNGPNLEEFLQFPDKECK